MWLSTALLSGCAVSGLSFKQDYRVDILNPGENDEVTLPFEVDWTVEDFGGHFAVFFDRSPMGPGKSLLSLVPDDDPCRIEPTCPDAQWLAERDVYVTDRTELLVEVVADQRDSDRSKDRHEMTIVLLDPTGRRVGESAFIKEFVVERED